MKTVITFGTFDIFHYGHVRLLERARECGDRLVVGLSTDEFNFKKKNHKPVFNYEYRKAILESLRCVDLVFPEESMNLKGDYIQMNKADILVMGDDWKGEFDTISPVPVKYLERTPTLSTTDYIKNIISSYKDEQI